MKKITKNKDKMMAKLLGMMVLVPCIAMFCVQGFAQNFNLDKVSEMPHFNEMPAREYVSNSVLFREKPKYDEHLAFEVRLPKEWTKASDSYSHWDNEVLDKTQEAEPKNLVGKIAKFVGPKNQEQVSYFEVRAVALEKTVTVKNWLLNFMLENGYNLQGVEVHSENKVSALYVHVEEDRTYIVRSIAQLNGRRIVMASYFLPDLRWQEERAAQERSVDSFHFLATKMETIETSRSYSFLDLVSFDYPISWTLSSPQIYSVEGMDVKLLNSRDNKTLDGEISIYIMSTGMETKLSEEVKFIKDELQNKGLEIGELIERKKDYQFNDHIYFNAVEIYKVKSEEAGLINYELWFAILAEDDFYYLVTLLTPERNQEFYTWAQNRESFKMVIESFRNDTTE